MTKDGRLKPAIVTESAIKYFFHEKTLSRKVYITKKTYVLFKVSRI